MEKKERVGVLCNFAPEDDLLAQLRKLGKGRMGPTLVAYARAFASVKDDLATLASKAAAYDAIKAAVIAAKGDSSAITAALPAAASRAKAVKAEVEGALEKVFSTTEVTAVAAAVRGVPK